MDDALTMTSTAEAPEPLTLKVMRLRQPPLLPPTGTPPLGPDGFAGCAESPKVLLPMTAINSLVGEPFTGYLHVANASNAVVKGVSLKVELQTMAGRVVLYNSEGREQEIQVGAFFDVMVEYELKDAGTYVLTCNVAYTSEVLDKTCSFRRSYRFPALQPFSVTHRAVQLGEDLLVECTVENSGQNNLYLTSWDLECVRGFQALPLDAGDGDGAGAGGGSFSCSTSAQSSSMHLLKPKGTHNLVFRVTSSDASGDVIARVRHLDVVGTLMLGWHLPDGPSGRAASHQVKLRPMASPIPMDMRVARCPNQVRIEEPFRVEIEIFNRSAMAMEPNLILDPRAMGSIRVHGTMLHSIGKIEPMSAARVPLDILVTAPGLHGLQGIYLVDPSSSGRSEFGALCDILAF